MDIVKYRMNFLDQLKPLDQNTNTVVELIQDNLSEIWSNLCTRVYIYDKNKNGHPVDRLMEYRVLAGKLAIDIQRAENTIASIRRLSESVSQEAQKIIKKKFWDPGEGEVNIS